MCSIHDYLVKYMHKVFYHNVRGLLHNCHLCVFQLPVKIFVSMTCYCTTAPLNVSIKSCICMLYRGGLSLVWFPDIDDCVSAPCDNGGICIDATLGYTCDCSATGFTGTTCQTGPSQSWHYSVTTCQTGPSQSWHYSLSTCQTGPSQSWH